MTEPFQYATPRNPEIEDCAFYHTVDIPGGAVSGHWDLRSCASVYTGSLDFSGARVLDVGTATGFLSFYAEKMGAREVVSLDFPDGAPHEIIPWSGLERNGLLAQTTAGMERTKNSYWYCHRALGSKCQAAYVNLYNLPESLGQFDIVLAGSILVHTENPFGALRNMAGRCAKTLVITEPDFGLSEMTFAPSYLLRWSKEPMGWWAIEPKAVARMTEALGFRQVRSNTFMALSPIYGSTQLYCSVFERV